MANVFAPDLKDAGVYEQGVPHETFARLRKENPVYWNPESDGAGFWAITKYDDIAEISRNPQIFSSAHEHGGHRIFNENEVSVGNTGEALLGTPFISLDPPLHPKYRMLAMRGVTPHRIAGIEARIIERARGLLDAIPDCSDVEFVKAFSAPLPLLTLAELLDVPADLWPKLYDWTNCFVGEDDPDFRRSPEDLAQTLGEFIAFSHDLFNTRRAAPGEDIASVLASAEIDGKPIGFADFLADLVLILVGGNETTRNSISHTLVAFSENPDQWTKLRETPALMETAVREMVRYANPVLHMRRTALQDVEIRGQKIRRGDKVVLWYISANRDEAIFDRPFDFNISRAENRHLAFGTGQHMCIGSRLAELQLRVAFNLLLERFGRIELLQPPRRFRSNFINGLKDLRLKLTPA